mmetsp:Transcript_56196/g.146508  ORF Transcript_56196/g.146508 Transcript_56196/m.146508 type:complete len:325 (-) Transcript_56196:1042-2016(-)
MLAELLGDRLGRARLLQAAADSWHGASKVACDLGEDPRGLRGGRPQLVSGVVGDLCREEAQVARQKRAHVRPTHAGVLHELDARGRSWGGRAQGMGGANGRRGGRGGQRRALPQRRGGHRPCCRGDEHGVREQCPLPAGGPVCLAGGLAGQARSTHGSEADRGVCGGDGAHERDGQVVVGAHGSPSSSGPVHGAPCAWPAGQRPGPTVPGRLASDGHACAAAEDGRSHRPRGINGHVCVCFLWRGVGERLDDPVCEWLHEQARWQAAVVEASHGPGGVHHQHCSHRRRHREGLRAVLRWHHAALEAARDERQGREGEPASRQGV